MKRAIIEHGSCKPKCKSQFENHEGKPNFLPNYYSYHEQGGNIEVPRQWLCYSPSLKKPYCEVCWLFADQDSIQTRAWIDSVVGDTHNMSTKIHKHKKSDQHIKAARSYGRWEAGKTVDYETEKQLQLNISF